jgi:hypothetical protein
MNISLLIVALLLLSGCASKNSKELIITYSNSISTVTKKTQSLFKEIETTRLNAKSLVLLTKGSAVKIDELKFKKLNSKGINSTLAYLNDFSSSLAELSSESSNKSLSSSMNKLNGSFLNLNETTNEKVDKENISNISTLVFSIGNFYLDSTKYEKLKEIVKVSQKSVSKKLIDLSKAILKFKKPYIRALKEERVRLLKLANYPHHYYINKYNKEIRNSYLLKINDHKEFYKELILINNKITKESERFDLLSKSFLNISKLHDNIKISLDNDDEVMFSKIKKDSYDIKLKLETIKIFKKDIKE